MERGLVSCEWLRAELDRPDVEPPRIVDATWYFPGSPWGPPEGSSGAQADYMAGPRLPGAVFFDIDAVSDPQNPLPHMLPSEDMFSAAMAALGITRESRVVIYDRHGVFSSPRFWYTLKVAFGHPGEVAVLDGGLPCWQELGYPVETGEADLSLPPVPTEVWRRVDGSSWDLSQVRDNLDVQEALVVDVRPGPRFKGQVAEPRPGVRAGHVPGSVNVPFVSLLTQGPGAPKLLEADQLRERFAEASVNLEDRTIVTTCGSGMTACIAGLAMHQVGMPLSRLSLYDGSWSEWGAQRDTPIVRVREDGELEAVP